MARARLLIAVVVVLLIGAGVWYWLTRGRESTDDAQIDSHVTQVSARVAGTIVRVAVDDNQTVDAGANLVEQLAGQIGVDLKRTRAQARVGEGDLEGSNVVLAVPTTYVNDSGRPEIGRASCRERVFITV